MYDKHKSKKGFTLVEIMIVVVIVGILAALAIPAFQRVSESSREKAIRNNLRQLYGAALQYFLEDGSATVASDDLVGTTATHYIRNIRQVANETYPASLAITDSSITTSGTPVIIYYP